MIYSRMNVPSIKIITVIITVITRNLIVYCNMLLKWKLLYNIITERYKSTDFLSAHSLSLIINNTFRYVQIEFE